MSGVTLDAGGLIALDRNDRRVIVLLARANEVGARVTVPATALAQAIRAPARQARLARLIRQPTTKVMPLDAMDATQVGVLLAASRSTDIADAHVVICARRHREPIVTSDPGHLKALDSGARLILVCRAVRALAKLRTDFARRARRRNGVLQRTTHVEES